MADEAGAAVNTGDGLRSPAAERRLEAMGELAARASPPSGEELEALVACLGDARKIVQRRAAELLAALERRGTDVKGRLRALHERGDGRERWGSVYALSIMDALGPEGVETLAESLGLADRDLRWAALDVLKKLAGRHRDAVVTRAIDLANDGSAVQRRMAFYLLRDLGAREDAAIGAAVDALGAADVNLRLAALAALAAPGADSIQLADRIAALLSDPDLPVARAAAATLGTLPRPTPRTIEALRAARLAADSSLRRAAEAALRRLEPDATAG